MKLIKPSFEILAMTDCAAELVEECGRTCYKSESAITANSASAFINKIMIHGHESVIEHASASVRIVCDRGVSHEIVRHRLASYSQESTRYCNYAKTSELTFIIPCWLKGDTEAELDRVIGGPTWLDSMRNAEENYLSLLSDCDWSPQQARAVLPNSLKTEIVMTANLREWRHFFNLRTSKAAHPQMREIATPMLEAFAKYLPDFFNGLARGINHA